MKPLSVSAEGVLGMAHSLAARFGVSQTSPEHLLLGMIAEENSAAATVLKGLQIDLATLRERIFEKIQNIRDSPTSGSAGLSPDSEQVLQNASQEAKNLGSHAIEVEHLLLGVLRKKESLSAQILLSFGINLEKIRAETLRWVGMEPSAPATGKVGEAAGRMTERLHGVLQRARKEADRLGRHETSNEHILQALLFETDGVAVTMLKQIGVDTNALRRNLEDEIEALQERFHSAEPKPKEPESKPEPEPQSIAVDPDGPPLGVSANHVLELARQEALSMGVNFVGTEHLLLGLARHRECLASNLLELHRVTLEKARASLLRLMGMDPAVEVGSTKPKTPALDAFGTDLTEMARSGKLREASERNEEIDQIVQILHRRTKNNPLLIWKDNAAKISILAGLAHRMARGDVPAPLGTKRLIALDFAALAAGTRDKSESQDRFVAAINETERSGNILLFIDDLQNLLETRAAKGLIGATAYLQQALSQASVQCLSATPIEAFQKSSDQDRPLMRCFQTLFLDLTLRPHETRRFLPAGDDLLNHPKVGLLRMNRAAYWVVFDALTKVASRRADHASAKDLLLSLLREENTFAWEILVGAGIDPAEVLLEVQAQGDSTPALEADGPAVFCRVGMQVLQFAMEEAGSLGSSFIGTDHLLLGFLREEGHFAESIRKRGLDLEGGRKAVRTRRDSQHGGTL